MSEAREALGCLFSRAQKHVEGQEYRTVEEYEQIVLKALDRQDELEKLYEELPQILDSEFIAKVEIVTRIEADLATAKTQIEELKEQDEANTELIGVFNVRELELERDLATEGAKVKRLMDELATSSGELSCCHPWRSKEGYCESQGDCGDCWQQWLTETTRDEESA